MQEPRSVTDIFIGQFADPGISTNRDSRTFHQAAHKLRGGVSALRTDLTSNCRYIFGKGYTYGGVYLWDSHNRLGSLGMGHQLRRVNQ